MTTKQPTAAQKKAAAKAEAEAKAAELAKTEAIANAAEQAQADTDTGSAAEKAEAAAQDTAQATEQAQAGTDEQGQAGDDTGENPPSDLQNAQTQADADVQAQAQNNAEASAKALSTMGNTDYSALGTPAIEPDVAEAKGTELTPFQLRVKNNGARAICHVTHALIAANSETVITYQTIQDKDLAKGNFAQINKLKGSKRFEVEG